MIRCLGALSLALVAASAAAAEASAVAPGAVFPVLQMLIALAAVVAAILGTAWLLRRFGPTPLAAGGAMRVLGGVAVGPRERLVLVEIGETWLVVGVAPGRVSAVHAMPRPENALVTEVATPASPFAQRLKAMLAGRRD